MMETLLNQSPSVAVDRAAWVCPHCHADLTPRETTLVCCNTGCNREYPVVAGIPILINEDRSLFRIAEFVEGQSTTFNWQRIGSRGEARGLIRTITRALADYSPSLSLPVGRISQEDACAEILAGRPDARVLVIGCGNKRFPGTETADIVYTDVSLGPITEVVCDASDIPFKDATFDGVISSGVLGYVSDPYRCVDEIRRVLRPGGKVYDACAFLQGIAMGRYDFTRFTFVGHRRLFRGFDEIEAGIASGPAMALAWQISYFFESFFEGPQLRKAVRVLVRYLFFWIKYLDLFLIRRRGAYDGASGFYFWGSKRDQELSDREILDSHRGLRPR